MGRPPLLVAVALLAAFLGGTAALAVGKATGWVDGGETVVVPAPGSPARAADDAEEETAAAPLSRGGFDPAAIYRERAAGVVTIFAVFGPEAPAAQRAAAQGSGFVVSDDGHILTNSHVVTTAGDGDSTPVQATTVYVEFRDGERVPGRVVGWDVYNDVAVVKVDARDHPLTPLPLGDSSRVVVGEPVAAIGSPFGIESSLSVGVVAATERSIDSLTSPYSVVDAIQTDAPINRGNSGGPLFDAQGRVIGINAQIRSESGVAEGVGFAIPINSAKRSLRELVATGRVRYAWLGVSTQTVTPRLAHRFGYGAERGAAVQSVVPGSPAEKAGLRAGGGEEEFEGIRFRPGGDLIVAIDGHRVASAEDVVRVVAERLRPGQTATLTVVRGTERRRVDVRLADRPPDPPDTDR